MVSEWRSHHLVNTYTEIRRQGETQFTQVQSFYYPSVTSLNATTEQLKDGIIQQHHLCCAERLHTAQAKSR